MTFIRNMFVACALALMSTGAAQAQFGAQPIKILYGFAPGSGGDLLARVIAEKMQAALGVSVVVENRTGDRKSTRLNSSHVSESRMPSSA